MHITFRTCAHELSAAYMDFVRDEQLLIHELPTLESWVHELAATTVETWRGNEWPDNAHEFRLSWSVSVTGAKRLPVLVAEIRRYIASGLPCELTAQFLQSVERSALGALN